MLAIRKNVMNKTAMNKPEEKKWFLTPEMCREWPEFIILNFTFYNSSK